MIDTAAYAERLEREGDFTPKQARMLAQQRFEIEESMMTKADLANLATRQDISDLRLEIAGTKTDIKALALATKADIAQLESKLTVRMGVMLSAAVGIMLAGLRFMLP